jgi:hypothetical protein
MWWSLMSRGRGAEERNSFSYENRHASDNVTLNEPRAPEPLNGDPTVDVEVVGTTRSEFVRPGGLFGSVRFLQQGFSGLGDFLGEFLFIR